MSNEKELNCNFCGKSRDNVEKLIAGPNVYICDECISISYDIIQKDPDVEFTELDIKSSTPPEINDFLNEHIIGNTNTKEIISVSAYNHYKRILSGKTSIEKSNILLVGPTGSGKTLFAKTLAKKLQVPFAIADATTLTEAGYVGEDVESVLERLLSVADYDLEHAQKGIIYIDEIDKKARRSESNTSTRDVSGEGVQQALLRLIEGTTTKVKISNGKKLTEDFVEFNTEKVLFILGGAFVGIEKDITARLKQKSSIGFGSSLVDSETKNAILHQLTSEDLIRYGLLPELVGRLPIVTTLNKLDKKDLKKVLTDVKNSIIIQLKDILKIDGIDVNFGDDFYNTVAEKASKVDLGARALKSILEEAMFSLMYNAPDFNKKGIVAVNFDKYPDANNFPLAIYEDGREETLTNYKLYRGENE